MAARALPVLPEPAKVSFVEPAWLVGRCEDMQRLRVLDVRVDAVARGRGGRASREHVPRAVPLDVRAALFDAYGEVVSAPEIALVMSSLGVGDEHTIVLVDEGPTYLARAAAWALGRYGHHDVHVLAGGHARWAAERRPLSRDVVRHPFASFTARVRPS